MEPIPKKRFRANFVEFIGFLEQVVNDARSKGFDKINPFLIQLAAGYLAKADDDFVIESFIGRSRSHWGQIEVRDEKYLIDAAEDIFSGVPVENIKPFKELFSAGYVSKDDMELFWEYYRGFVVISLKHLKGKGEDTTEQLRRFQKK